MHGGVPERPVHVGAAGQGGQFHGVGHLLQDPLGAGGGGFFEPHRRAGAQSQEALFAGGAGPHTVIAGNLVAVVGKMRVVNCGVAPAGAAVARHLERAAVIEGADHHLISAGVVTDPHRLPQQRRRNGVLAVLEADHRGVVRDPPGHPQRRGVRQIGDRVQGGAFSAEHLDWTPARAAVHPGIDLVVERRTGCLHLGERVVVGQQVGLGGHDVGLGELDGVLHPTLARRIGGLTGQYRDSVEAAERHCGAVADRDPGDMSGRDGLLVVGQQIGRGAPEDAEDAVQAGEHTGCGPVPQRHHDAVATPRQPRHQQHDCAACHQWALAEVVLQPQTRLSDPRTVHTRIAKSPLGFDLRHRPPRSAVAPGVTQRDELVVGLVAADLSLRISNPGFQQVAPIVDHPGPPSHRRQPRRAVLDRLLHGVVRAAAQFGGGAI